MATAKTGKRLGRPRAINPHDHVVQVKFTKDECEALDELVEAMREKARAEGSLITEPTRASVLRGLVWREALAHGIRK